MSKILTQIHYPRTLFAGSSSRSLFLGKPNINDRHEEVIAKVSIDPTAENISKLNEQIEQNIIRNTDNTFSCQFCGKNSGKVRSYIRNHIESHLVGLSFNCPMCEKTFRTRSSLANHKYLKHRT